MGPALDEFKAGAFLQSQNRNRKAQKQSSEEARPGARALVSLPEASHGVGRREVRTVPLLQNLNPAQVPPCLNCTMRTEDLG